MRFITVVLLVGLAACSPAGPGRPAASSSPAPSPSLQPVPNGGECPFSTDPSLPEGSGCVSKVIAGDEELTIYAPLDDAALPRRWRIRLTSPEADVDQRLPLGNAFSYPRVLGATDIGDNGTTEWWIKAVDYTSHGAPWSGAHVYVFEPAATSSGRPDALRPLTLDGEVLAVNYGGISRLGEGARCEGDSLTLMRAEAKNVRNTIWATSERTFTIIRATAEFVDRTAGRLRISDYNDPDLDPYFRIDCDGFVFP